jgi:hypothetical protein
VRIEGEVRLTADFTGIASLSRGGRVRIEENDGRAERRLDVRPGQSGALTYDYEVDGRKVVFDAAGRTWLEGFLVNLYRVTGFAARERSAWILAQRGPEGVFAEIELLRGDHARRLYLETLLVERRADSAIVERALRLAGETISSDHSLAELLIAIGDGFVMDERTRSAYLQAQRGIESDHDQRRVLTALLSTGRLTAAQMADVLASAKTIESDHDLAELLIAVVESGAVNGAVETAFLEALEGVESSHDYRRVATALLRREQGGRR